MIKAAIFDMDGLLIDSEPLWQRVERVELKKLGVDLTDEDIHNALGRGIPGAVDYYYRAHQWQGPSQAEIVAKIIADFVELVEVEGVMKPGVHQVIELCKSRGLPTAIASSSNRHVINTVVDKLQLREFFDEIYSAEHEPYGKPHPGVFISTANLLDVAAEDCLVFEDAPSGVLAAKAAKMKCVAVPEPKVKANKFIQTADVIIDSLAEFDEKMLSGLS